MPNFTIRKSKITSQTVDFPNHADSDKKLMS